MNGGLFKTNISQYFPQVQVVDQITKEFKKAPINKIFLKQKYVTEGLSSAEIGKLTFSSRVHITNLLNRFDIPLKVYTRRSNGGHVYGYRKYGGKSIELKKEQEVMKMIKSHRASGYSYQKIADILNEKKIETKLMKGFWYSKVVRQIYQRSSELNVFTIE